MRRTLLALAVLLALPAGAAAAPPWSTPQDLSGPHTFVDGLWVGGGKVGWRSEDGEVNAPTGRSGDPVFFVDDDVWMAPDAHDEVLAEYERWRIALDEGGRGSASTSKRIRTLERELARKEKALAEAAALLVLKKVETLYGEGEEDDIDEEMSVGASVRRQRESASRRACAMP